MSVILLTSSKSKYWWQTSFSLLVRRQRRCEFICTPLEPFKRSSPLVARARACMRVCSLSLSLSPLLRFSVREKSEKKRRRRRRRRETEPLARACWLGPRGRARRGILFPLTLISTTQKTVATRRSLKLRILWLQPVLRILCFSFFNLGLLVFHTISYEHTLSRPLSKPSPPPPSIAWSSTFLFAGFSQPRKSVVCSFFFYIYSVLYRIHGQQTGGWFYHIWENESERGNEICSFEASFWKKSSFWSAQE